MNEGHDLDLGDGHWFDWLVMDFESKERVGAVITHITDKTSTGMCSGIITWAPTKFEREHPERLSVSERSRHKWHLDSLADEHITLSSSVLCAVCGDHGFIRDGKWVRA